LIFTLTLISKLYLTAEN